MEAVYRPPSILRLTGITLADYVPVEDVADRRLLDPSMDGADGELEAAPEEAQPLDKIPRVFTGLEDWPHRTNLRCWWCGFTFDDRPKFEATYVREAESGGVEFGVRGNMCTFNCAEAWIELHYGGHANNEKRWRAQDNLCLAYFMFTGRRVPRIKPAPSRTELRQYGGEWDEDTYWRRLRELDPLAGLRDHTPGSVVPERDRARMALAGLRPQAEQVRTARPGLKNVWEVCGERAEGERAEGERAEGERAEGERAEGEPGQALRGTQAGVSVVEGRAPHHDRIAINLPAGAGAKAVPAPAGAEAAPAPAGAVPALGPKTLDTPSAGLDYLEELLGETVAL